MLVLALVLLAMAAGPISFLTHPSREDPRITIREASVVAQFPGMPADKVEQLITSVIEQKIREISQVSEISSTSSTGQALVHVTVGDQYTKLAPIWTDLRDKMDQVRGELPAGALGPSVDSDRGDVAMATIALTAEGFDNAELHTASKWLRRQLYAAVPGVNKISFYGVEEQTVFIDFDPVRLAQLGLAPKSIAQAVQSQNVVQPGGQIQVDGQTLVVQPSGDFTGIEEIRNLPIALENSPGQALYLGDIADIEFGYSDPPGPQAFYNGSPAVVIAISMVDGFDAGEFDRAITAALERAQVALPIGMFLDVITFQPAEIDAAIYSVLNNLWQTVLIVLAVVIAFLGLRTGLIVGLMVPLVMVITLLAMRAFGIELERMSLASLIISLGLLVDNGIVIAEELQNRLSRGMERLKAAREVGAEMGGPLLAASMTTVFAFMPLMLMPGGAGEYTRSISVVVAIALLVSWATALTALALFCVWFLRPGAPVDEDKAYAGPRYQAYRRGLSLLVRWRWVTMIAAFGTIAIGLMLFGGISKTFFPASERTQLQVIVELPVGSNTYATRGVVERLQSWLDDRETNSEVASTIAYVATGGPRFYLSLSPIDGFPNKGYFIVNVDDAGSIDGLANRIRSFAASNAPEARVMPEKMSLGPAKAGEVAYRIYGPNASELMDAADRLKSEIRQDVGARAVKDDWENPTVTLRIVIDQEAARRVGVTSADISEALNAQLSGVAISDYRLGDLSIPILVRSAGEARQNIDRLRTLNIGRADGTPVPLLQVAQISGVPQYSRIKRRDLERVVTVSSIHATDTAAAFHGRLIPAVTEIASSLPPGYRIETGGEVEESRTANEKLSSNLPLALALIVLTLIWQFNSFSRAALVLAVVPLSLTGVGLALFVAPGANFGFMAILGLLALFGIIINNAIILIERIDIERERCNDVRQAVVEASVRRLRPIAMTTCTTALGLAPIILARDVLFYDLALVIAGGLFFGTLLTLVVIPCLYAICFIPGENRRVRASLDDSGR